MIDLEKIADDAEVIISGFAFWHCKEGIKVFDLNDGEGVAIFQQDGTLIETNMDDIELVLAKKRFDSAITYMEETDAKVL